MFFYQRGSFRTFAILYSQPFRVACLSQQSSQKCQDKNIHHLANLSQFQILI
jgi:hypothetical protein